MSIDQENVKTEDLEEPIKTENTSSEYDKQPEVVSENAESETDNAKKITEEAEVTDECAGNDTHEVNEDSASHSDNEHVLPSELAELKETQREITEKLQKLSDQFEKRIMYVEHEEKIIDNMHKELQEYKDDLKFQLIKPILQDIISVADSISRMSAAYLAKPEGEQDIPNAKFLGYVDDLHDIMENNGIDIYKSHEGDNFTPIKQRIIEKVETEDETLNGKIAKSYTHGYEKNGKVITAEKVAVYVLKK